MSLMDRINVLNESAKARGFSKDLLEKVFAGSSMDAFDDGSEVTDVITWDEGSQSAIAFLVRTDDTWKTMGFSICEDVEPGSWDEWKELPAGIELVQGCIEYADASGISLESVGCTGASKYGARPGEADDVPAWARTDYGETTLYKEVRSALKLNGYSEEDVLYAEVMTKNCNVVCIEGSRFLEMAKEVKYNAYQWVSKPAIQDDLRIVFKNGSFLSRMCCDGSEWFKLYEAPDLNPKYSNLDRKDLCLLNADLEGRK